MRTCSFLRPERSAAGIGLSERVVSRNSSMKRCRVGRLAEQELEQARVARDRTLLDLRRATVRAPFSAMWLSA